MSDEGENVELVAPTSMTVNPADLKDEAPPAGWYQGVVSYCRFEYNPKDRKVDPGKLVLNVGYRLEAEGFPWHGLLVRPWGVLVNKADGSVAKYARFLKTMGFDTKGEEFTFEPDSVVGFPVRIKLGRKLVKDEWMTQVEQVLGPGAPATE